MIRDFKIFAEIPDGKDGVFHEEVETFMSEQYPDHIDISYFKTIALDMFPDATFIQIYELAEEIKISKDKK